MLAREQISFVTLIYEGGEDQAGLLQLPADEADGAVLGGLGAVPPTLHLAHPLTVGGAHQSKDCAVGVGSIEPDIYVNY